MEHNEKIRGKKIALFAHVTEGTSGLDDELVLYLRKNGAREIVYVKFPFTFSSRPSVKVFRYIDGKECYSESLIRFYKPEPLSYIKDFLYAIFYGIQYCRGVDLFIGMNNLLAFSGIVLKKLHLVKKVAYYMIDYTPIRYDNVILNNLYYRLDKLACYHSDIVLPLHEKLIEGRVNHGRIVRDRVRYVVTPFGNNSDMYADEEYTRFDRKKIVYFGGVMKSKGAELFVPIIQELIKRGNTDVVFECLGGGDTEYLRNQVKANSLEKFFNIYGRIEDHQEVEKMLLGYGVAIAPYYPEDENNFSYYTDPGKVKVYLGCGLPIVITDVPPIAQNLAERGAGLISRYDASDFAEKIMKILDPVRYNGYRGRAIVFGKEFSWKKIFSRVFNTVF